MSQSESNPHNSFVHYLWGSKGTPRFWISMIVTLALVLAVPITVMMVGQQQTIFSRAAGCTETPVNVEFRVNAKTNTPWTSGKNVKVKTGDVLEVNCFAKAGSALLSNASMTGTVNGQTIDIEEESSFYDGAQIRGMKVEVAGTYEFICQNAKKCSNKDTFTTRDADGSASPSPGTSASPSPSCTTYTSSDLNNDCRSTVEDYDLFLRDFIEQQD